MTAPVDGTVQFVAQARGGGESRLLGVSDRLKSLALTPEGEGALARLLIDALHEEGWEQVGTGSQWYCLRFRHRVPSPGEG